MRRAIYPPETEAPVDRIKGYGVAPEQITPCIDERRPQRRFWEDVTRLDMCAIAHHKRIRHDRLVQRWKANSELCTRLDALHHLRNTVRIWISNHDIWYCKSFFCADIHLRNAGVDQPRAAVLALAINAETHFDHGPVSRIVCMCQTRLEVGKSEVFDDFLRQAKTHAMRGDFIPNTHGIARNISSINRFDVQERVHFRRSIRHTVSWPVSTEADAHIRYLRRVSHHRLFAVRTLGTFEFASWRAWIIPATCPTLVDQKHRHSCNCMRTAFSMKCHGQFHQTPHVQNLAAGEEVMRGLPYILGNVRQDRCANKRHGAASIDRHLNLHIVDDYPYLGNMLGAELVDVWQEDGFGVLCQIRVC